MSTIGLVIKPGVKKALPLAEKVCSWAKSKKHKICLDEKSEKLIGREMNSLGMEELVSTCDAIVVLGGDGSMIGVARYTGKNPPKLLGVKFGTLGFLTEITPEELLPALEETLEGKASFAKRSILYVEVKRGGEIVFSSQAVNDVVIQKESASPLFDIDMFSESQSVMRLRGDGLIFATPTGSTAYSLAAGGSIVHPELNCFLVTPICPHALTNRPLVLPSSSKLFVRIPDFKFKIHALIDGQVSQNLISGDEIMITESKNSVHFVRSPSKSYFDILRTKLNWGTIPNFD